MRMSMFLSVLVMTACGGTTDESDATDASVVEDAPVNVWEDVEPVARYFEKAADISWKRLDGTDFVLSEHYTGDDSFVVLLFVPGSGYHDAVWNDARPQKLLNSSPDNTHYIFGSWESEASARKDRLEALQGDFEQALARMGEEAQAHWADRLHFVTPRPDSDNFGWAGELGAANIRRTDAYHAGVRNVGFGIDQRQRIRPIGEFVDWAANGSYPMEYLANHAVYFDFEEQRQRALDAEEAMTVRLWDNENSGTGWGGNAIYVDVEMPDHTSYDTLHLDLLQSCTHIESITDKNGDGRDDNNGASVGDLNCPEWDRITSLHLCENRPADAGKDFVEVCDLEVGRWITGYTSEGRWVHDISPLLAALPSGQTARFKYKAIDNHPITLDFRFTTTGQARPTQLIPLYSGGQLTACTNDRYEPMDVTIPAEATRVELAAVITGHSFGKESKNCAEFCNHEHHFVVGGETYTEDHPEANDYYGCRDAVDIGVYPNQYGSWIFGRAGWCPGQEVPMWRQDVTDQITAGGTTTVDYSVTVDGQNFDPYWTENPGWDCASGEGAGFWVPEFSMASWLVVYE